MANESASPRRGTCPVCKSSRLEPHEIEPHLPTSRCPTCSGFFLVFDDYLTWQSGQTPAPAPTPSTAQGAPDADTGIAKLCPSCGRFMTRFRIALDVPFRIDRCGGCAGMWFESGEWATLKARGIHTRLNSFFSDAWQHQLKSQDSARQQEDRYLALLGPDDLDRVRDFRTWANAHPRRSVIFAYLEADDLPPARPRP